MLACLFKKFRCATIFESLNYDWNNKYLKIQLVAETSRVHCKLPPELQISTINTREAYLPGIYRKRIILGEA